jgi:gluconolactonase
VYRLAPGASELSLLVDDFSAPNGLALSKDERTLYVDDTIGMHLRAFDVDHWKLKNGRVLFEFPHDVDPGVPDGLKLDDQGNIYCTGPFGVWVISSSGTALGRIDMPEVTANLNWGEDDGHTLFLAASTSLYQLRTLVRGKYVGG